jgi:hypothetical protein
MAEYLGSEEHYLQARLANLMQVFVHTQESQIQEFHQRLDALLFQYQQRVTEMEWRSEGLPLTPVERQDGLYDLLHDMHDDRIEYQEANVIAAIDRQMDRLQQRETGQGQGREHGMGL